MFFSVFQNNFEPYFQDFNAISIFEFNPILFHQLSNSLIIEVFHAKESHFKNPIIKRYKKPYEPFCILVMISGLQLVLKNFIISIPCFIELIERLQQPWNGNNATASLEYLFSGFCFYGSGLQCFSFDRLITTKQSISTSSKAYQRRTGTAPLSVTLYLDISNLASYT